MYPDQTPVRFMTDAVLDSAIHSNGTSVERLARIRGTSRELGQLLLHDVGEGEFAEQDTIQAGIMLACLPSLETLARGKKHTIEVAQKVCDDLVPVAQYIRDEKLYDTTNARTLGAVSEFSVLASLWWGIAHGKTTENSYALPTTSEANASSASGMRDGYDIVFKEGSPDGRRARRHEIQVKTKWGPKANTYTPRIKIIALSNIVPREHSKHANSVITRDLVKGTGTNLRIVWANIREILDAPKT